MTLVNAWTVQYFNGTAWTTINDVQDISCSVGRRQPLDQWPISTAQIRVRYPTGFASPLANFGTGTKIRFSAPGRSASKPMWTGLVADAQVEIGIEWNSGTSRGETDYLTINCEGYGAAIGRGEQVTIANSFTPFTAETVKFLIEQINSVASLAVGYDTTDTAFTTRKWDINWLSSYVEYPWAILQNIAVYGQWRICDGVRKTWSWAGSAGATDEPAVFISASPNVQYPLAGISFSDINNDADERIYDTVEFTGLADVYVTRAALSFEYNGTTETTIRTYGLAPWRTFTADLLPQTTVSLGTTTYIDETAQWYATAFTDQIPTIASVSATTYGQQTQNLDNLGITDLEFGMVPRYVIPVTLRGTTYLCQIEGATVTADVNGARYTYYLSPSGQTAWFTLDSNEFGVLDRNRLGVY